MKLTANMQAPDFTAEDQHGKKHSLSDYKGKWLVLFFYPKDNTPGCTKEVCQIRDQFSDLKKQASILGVSGDSVSSHAKFASKYSLPYSLLADPQKNMIKNYGANGLLFTKRCSFLINPEGKIAKVYESVDPSKHATEILEDLNQFEKKENA
ncbi:MAG: peroxiredoxin [Planctomycetota bacterium]